MDFPLSNNFIFNNFINKQVKMAKIFINSSIS